MRWTILITIGLLTLPLAACDEPATVGRGAPPGTSASAPPPPGDPTLDPGTDPAAAAEPDAGIGLPDYRDEDFVEADTNRDPFRVYLSLFVTRATPERVQREVVMPETPVEDLRLIAVVTGIADARAMFLDRNGRGHTVRRGDFVGQPEVVQVGGAEGTQATLNWRVDRITCTRPSTARGAAEAAAPTCEVILTRDDPSAPNRPPLTRVIPLREQETAQRAGIQLQ